MNIHKEIELIEELVPTYVSRIKLEKAEVDIS